MEILFTTELALTNVSKRQRAYRANYRQRVAGWYDGFLQIAIIYTIRLAALYIYISNIRNLSWAELVTVPVVLLFCDFFEWFLHRYIMHRPWKNTICPAAYNRHTLQHHQFLTEDEMRFANHRDYRVTFFPPYALATFTLMPGGIVLGSLFTPNVGWLFISTTTTMYMLYKFMDFCCHVKENWFQRSQVIGW